MPSCRPLPRTCAKTAVSAECCVLCAVDVCRISMNLSTCCMGWSTSSDLIYLRDEHLHPRSRACCPAGIQEVESSVFGFLYSHAGVLKLMAIVDDLARMLSQVRHVVLPDFQPLKSRLLGVRTWNCCAHLLPVSCSCASQSPHLPCFCWCPDVQLGGSERGCAHEGHGGPSGTVFRVFGLDLGPDSPCSLCGSARQSMEAVRPQEACQTVTWCQTLPNHHDSNFCRAKRRRCRRRWRRRWRALTMCKARPPPLRRKSSMRCEIWVI